MHGHWLIKVLKTGNPEKKNSGRLLNQNVGAKEGTRRIAEKLTRKMKMA